MTCAVWRWRICCMPPGKRGWNPVSSAPSTRMAVVSNWHPHVHVSVTCGGLNKHGQWKKLSFLERRGCVHGGCGIMRQPLLKAWSEGMAMPESLSHITTESQWRSPAAETGGKYWHVYMSKKTAGGRNTARYLVSYLKKPPIAASRLAHYNGGERNGSPAAAN